MLRVDWRSPQFVQMITFISLLNKIPNACYFKGVFALHRNDYHAINDLWMNHFSLGKENNHQIMSQYHIPIQYSHTTKIEPIKCQLFSSGWWHLLQNYQQKFLNRCLKMNLICFLISIEKVGSNFEVKLAAVTKTILSQTFKVSPMMTTKY